MLHGRFLKAFSAASALLLFTLSSFAQGVVCARVHDNLTLEEALRSTGADPTDLTVLTMYVSHLKTALPEDLRLGKRPPTWDDFERLRLLKSHWIEGMTTAKRNSQDGADGFQQRLREALFVYQDRHVFQNFSPENFLRWTSTDKDLLNAFAKELIALNQLLPKALRNSSLSLPTASEHAALIKDATAVVHQTQELTDQLFSTSGYSDLATLKKTIEEKGNDDLKNMLTKFENEDFEFAIARPENARWWIPRVGFHNQHVTGSSRGYRGTNGRNAVEATRLSVTTAEYENQDNNLKPKYGYLRAKIGDRLTSPYVHYGTDFFLLKKENLRERTTWTAGDSLNPASSFAPQWTRGISTTPQNWDHLFTPWSHRTLLAPFMTSSHVNVTGERSAKIGSEASQLQRSHPNNEYIELQFWGPVTLDDVHTFIFQREPPSGEFLRELKKKKIKIYDGRNNLDQPILWEPSL